MPTCARGAPRRAHSRAFVALGAAGYMGLPVTWDGGAGRGGCLVGEFRLAGPLFEDRRLRAARDEAGFLAVDVPVVPVAPDRAVDHLEPDELARRSFGLLLPQHVLPEELGLLPADDPPEIGFDDGRGVVHVVAV